MKTLGEQRMRVEFNPSQNSEVDYIKQLTANLIDLLEKAKTVGDDVRISSQTEKTSLLNIAQRKYEEAAMWAVKALTTPI